MFTFDRDSMIKMLAPADGPTTILLEKLSDKEVRILMHYPDIQKEIKKLAVQGTLTLLSRLRSKDYELEFNDCVSGSYFVGFSGKLEELAPDWIKKKFPGTWAPEKEMRSICLDMLLREIRINLWFRYLDYKRSSK